MSQSGYVAGAVQQGPEAGRLVVSLSGLHVLELAEDLVAAVHLGLAELGEALSGFEVYGLLFRHLHHHLHGALLLVDGVQDDYLHVVARVHILLLRHAP